MPDERSTWAAFITEQGNIARLLPAAGNVAYRESPAVEAGKLRDFLDRLGKANVDWKLLIRLYFLLQPRTRLFFSKTLRDLLRSASHVSAGTVQLSRAGVRGKILWPSTFQARMSGRAYQGAYSVRRPERSPDVPENRLLALFLSEVTEVISEIRGLIGTGALLSELDEMHQQAAAAMFGSYLRAVETPRRATSLMYQRAVRHRNSGYRRLASLQKQFDHAIWEGKLLSVIRLLQKGWLEPIKDDDMFELYVLVLILYVLEHDLDLGPPHPGLIRRGRRQVAIFDHQSKGVRVEVFFDQSPTRIFGRHSSYISIMRSYDGISGSGHRPDIIISADYAGGDVRALLVEAKNSSDESYKRRSLYKVLGYLKDFESIWEMSAQLDPKAMLVFPTSAGVTPKAAEAGQSVVMTVANRERIAELLGIILAQ